MWIKSEQNGILVNLDNIADLTVKESNGHGTYVLIAYTSSGFGMNLYRGNEKDCYEKLDAVGIMLSVRGV